ncbi:MAG: gamma-glutamyltransferase family protein [Pseudomonadota bacterium]
MRSFHQPGRSPVYAPHAMCASSHPLATAAAVDVMRGGGNAVDAAIAASAVLAVVEHPMTGIGGDCFAMVAKPDGSLVALNASGRAPAGASYDALTSLGVSELAMTSPHAVTVPGAIDGWCRLLADHGTWPLARLLAPAISYARDGFPVAPRVQFDWHRSVEKLSVHEGARQHLLFDGQAPAVGQMIRMPALADTLDAIARDGRDGFYAGTVGQDIVSELNALGGVHTIDDFAAQSSSYVTPIAVEYQGLAIHELPPNNHGIVALIMLRMLDRMGRLSNDPGAPERYHVMIESARLAYGMRDRFVADPEMADVPVDHMLSDETIETLVSRVDRTCRTPDLAPMPEPAGSDTVYLSVVDADGMAVSFINSLFSAFGSGIVTRKSGVVLHNRGQGFRMDPTHPNCIAPRKRPMHTLVPAIATENGQPVMSFGVMGAAFQPLGHVYVVTNMRDYGMDAQEALDFPRVFFEDDGRVMVEEGVSDATTEALRVLGHDVGVREEPWGGGQIVQIDPQSGVRIGASDPRKDGAALGF